MAPRGVRQPPYEAVELLSRIAGRQWHEFDGWCAARNVDPFELELARFLNLVYYAHVRNLDQEKREEFDRLLKRVVEENKDRVITPTARRAPSWFKGADGAAASSMEAARQMGFMIGEVN